MIIPMTHKEFVAYARKGGLIHWPNSGVYESLSCVHHKGLGEVISAHGPVTAKHLIEQRELYYCVPVGRETLITGGELLYPRRVPRVIPYNVGVNRRRAEIRYKKACKAQAKKDTKLVAGIMER